jgi:hypothetical protein
MGDFRQTVTSGSQPPILSREIKDIYEQDLKYGSVRGGDAYASPMAILQSVIIGALRHMVR